MTDKKNGSYRVYFHDKDRLGQGLDFSYTHTPAPDLRAFERHCHGKIMGCSPTENRKQKNAKEGSV